MDNPLQVMSKNLNVDPKSLNSILKNTIMPSSKPVTDEDFTTFVAVSNKYGLDPLTKEIYAFPNRAGGISPIVSIDGWLRIINGQEQFDGMDIKENFQDETIFSVQCSIYCKNRSHPVTVNEYFSECQRNTDTWRKWPVRMLRHKAVIQAGRYAFGLSGIYEEDEIDRIPEPLAGSGQVIIEAQESYYPEDRFDANKNTWGDAISSGKLSPESLINTIQSEYILTDEQKKQISEMRGDK